MFDFSVKDFRCFHQKRTAKIKPLTVLVGDNSAGKSSFLAGLKYMLDFCSHRAGAWASFNNDPFQLGTFQQISHFRGGKAGRAREFSLALNTKGLMTFVEEEFQDTEIEVKFFDNDSQASVKSVSVKNEIGELSMGYEKGELNIQYQKNRKTIKFNTEVLFSRDPGRGFVARYWFHLLDDFISQLEGSTNKIEGYDELSQDELENISTLAQMVSLIFQDNSVSTVIATSAIRTKPLRTYTPGGETIDSEGSHVPFEIAKLYRSKNKMEWRKIKQAIDKFGQSAGMFDDISVKSFGNSASDPFQIQFSSKGPKTNIIDIGYGTSQILPIVYNIASGRSNSVYLIQQPEVHLHPKAQAALGEFFVEMHLERRNGFVIETHSDFILDRIRHAVFENRISKDDVSIIFFKRGKLDNTFASIQLDDFGDPIEPPVAYRDFFVGEQIKLLGA